MNRFGQFGRLRWLLCAASFAFTAAIVLPVSEAEFSAQTASAGNSLASATCFPGGGAACEFLVNSTADTDDSNVGDGACDSGNLNSVGDPECTFRAAITETNANPDRVSIRFDIPNQDPGHVYYQDNGAAGLSTPTPTVLDDASITDFDADYPSTAFSWWQISPATQLPSLTSPILIDGYTQPGSSPNSQPAPGPLDAILRIEIEGASSFASILDVQGGQSTIRGLVIDNGFNGAITVGSDANEIVGNWIGPDIVGTEPGFSTDTSVWIQPGASGNTIGTSDPADRNVLSHSSFAGIYLEGDANTVDGNYIGVDSRGIGDLSASIQDTGIFLVGDNNQIGIAGSGNVIGRNGDSGIWASGASSNVFHANLVVANSDTGVTFTGSSNNTFGGTDPSQSNTIRNTQIAPAIGLSVDSDSSGNAIVGNSIFDNDGLGIDLGASYGDGVTLNDPGDVDGGANDQLNFPIIKSASDVGGTIAVSFDLDLPAGDYIIEFFSNPSGADPSGFGEGEQRTTWVTTSHAGGGVQPYGSAFPGVAGDVITATVTQVISLGVYGSTSEFSAAVTATP